MRDKVLEDVGNAMLKDTKRLQMANKPVAEIHKYLWVPLKSKVTSGGVAISLTESIRRMQQGESIILDSPAFRSRVTATAKHLKVKVETRKHTNGTLVVTRR